MRSETQTHSTMTPPNIPAKLSFDGRGINDLSQQYAPRVLTLTPGALGKYDGLCKAIAALPEILEAMETTLQRADIFGHEAELMRCAMLKAGYKL